MLDLMTHVSQKSEYTFKYNRTLGRHGWLRLTPAYSVKLVEEILHNYNGQKLEVLDPFSGTGTTGIVAAENGHDAILFDINPFLIWFAKEKSKNYLKSEIDELQNVFDSVVQTIKVNINRGNWIPSIFNIERWWDKKTLLLLSAVRQSIVDFIGEVSDQSRYGIIWIAFCRLVIETSSAAFNHVSMSFKDKPIEYEEDFILNLFIDIFETIKASVQKNIPGNVTIINSDSRSLDGLDNIDLVITSPPYPNRISYIRELRPYMYWTKFIQQTTEASDIDWKAIGGTWGAATSKLLTWEPKENINLNLLDTTFEKIIKTNEKNSQLMAIYVKKYFYDTYMHINNLRKCLKQGSELYYIIGNSNFFGIPVDSSQLYIDILSGNGFSNIKSRVIRKRNCNKQLFEYCISATK